MRKSYIPTDICVVLESDRIKCFCPPNHPTVKKLKIAGDFAKIFWYLSNTAQRIVIGYLKQKTDEHKDSCEHKQRSNDKLKLNIFKIRWFCYSNYIGFYIMAIVAVALYVVDVGFQK